MNSAQLAKVALDHVARLLSKLTEEQLTELAEGRAHLEFQSNGTVTKSDRSRAAAAKPAPDVAEAVAAVQQMESAVEVQAYLKKYKVDELRAIARALGPTVSAQGTKAQLLHNIADGAVGFRGRAAAVGGWDR